MDYFCCFPANNCLACSSHFIGKDRFLFHCHHRPWIVSFGAPRSQKGQKSYLLCKTWEARLLVCEWAVSLILEARSCLRGLLLGQIQREIARVLMGMGAPTQELSNFTVLGPSARLQPARSQLDTSRLSTAWPMPQPQARKPSSQG